MIRVFERRGWMVIRVLIADDHPAVRAGLRALLKRDPELDIVGEAANGTEAVAKARQLQPDVVLMDLLLPEIGGIAATAIIRSELPETEVLILTVVLEQASVSRAIRAGAIGYLLKEVSPSELRSAVKSAGVGQVHLSPQAAMYLLREIRALAEQTESLTERETVVLRLLARGHSNREIAHTLHITQDTVKTYIRRILVKFNVKSRTQAVLIAIRLGIVPLDSIGNE
jgi:NarL family two-component system response regulator LiaR